MIAYRVWRAWHERRDRVAAIAQALLATTALSLVGPVAGLATAQAQEVATAKRSFDIPPQALDGALAAYSRIAGVQVLNRGADTQNVKSRGVRGSFTTEEALTRLLGGTGLMPRFAGANTVTVSGPSTADDATNVPGAISLDTINVQGGSPYPTDPYAGMINPPTTIGSKEPLIQRQIPQSVSVINQEELRQQNATTLNDAMRYAPGVTTQSYVSNYSAYYSRGFPISTFQYDGVPAMAMPGGSSLDSFADNLTIYDRVEVLRGPSGLLNGFGGDGGVINLVRKRAPSQFQASADLIGGTYDNVRGQMDVGGPLNKEGTIRGRFVASENYQHLMQDSTWQNDKSFYGTLEADVTPSTTVRVGASYTDTNGRPMYGLPSYSNYMIPDLPRSAFLGPTWNYVAGQHTNAFAEVKQKLGNDWVATGSYNYFHGNSNEQLGIITPPVDPVTNIATDDLYSVKTGNVDNQNVVDLNATGPFSLFGRTHHLTVGATYLHDESENNLYYINPATGLDFEGDVEASIFDNSAYSDAFAGGPQQDNVITTNQYGAYANARWSLADPLTLVTGGRMTWWNSSTTVNQNPYYNFFNEKDSSGSVDGKFSPIVGLIYDLNNNYSLYGSYSTIFVPQTGDFTYTGTIIAPIEGAQYETGIKGEYFEGRLNASAALFQMTETNRAISDPLHPQFFVASGTARSRGVDLQVSGQILPEWNVYGGYTFTTTQNFDVSTGGQLQFSVVAPKHLFKLWTSYQLPGQWNKWMIAGGVYATSKSVFIDKTGFLSDFATDGGTLTAPAYATFDARISYQVTKQIMAALSVTNVFDTRYITTISSGANGTYYGNPRVILLSLHASL